MTTMLTRFLLSLLLLMPMPIVQAQPGAGDAGSAEQQTGDAGEDDSSTTDEQGEATDSDTDLPDIDSQPIESSQSEGPGRFIPSEQISQDFGVSFPVDI